MRKQWLIQCIAAALVAVGLPALLLALGVLGKEAAPAGTITTVTGATQAATKAPTAESGTEPEEELQLPILMADGTVVDMPLETYIAGVVLGEVPADFQLEARCAQAVAARTFALARLENPKHGTAALCTDSNCCQAWRQLGEDAASQAALEAAERTKGLVLRYDGELINATYFSCSGGRTEAAVEVWGGEVPYLQSVESPGEDIAEHDVDTQLMTLEAFQEAILAEAPEAVFSGSPESWFGAVTYTQGGGVEAMTIGGVTFTGTQLRQILGLRSTNMTFTAAQSGIAITTRGYGHRVGMSQYGAEAMARAGSTFEEILAHYYVGTVLEPYA